MRWFWRRARGESIETLRDVLNVFGVDMVKAQTEALRERTTADLEFLKAMADLKTTTAARALGRKGGKRSGEVRAARKAQRQRGQCPICTGDRANATREFIRWHLAGHPAGRDPGAQSQPPAPPAPESSETSAN
jgi:hypothetical protein